MKFFAFDDELFNINCNPISVNSFYSQESSVENLSMKMVIILVLSYHLSSSVVAILIRVQVTILRV